MYFTSAFIVLAGLSSLTSAYDDGLYHPDVTTTATVVSHTTYTSAVSQATYVSETSQATWYPTLSKSTYIGYWSGNGTTMTSSMSASSMVLKPGSNMTMTMKPGNASTTMTMVDRVYTTTICDFQSSCYTTLATAAGGFGQARPTGLVQPTMTPFSSSGRLVAGGWGALVLCGIALLL